MRLNKPDLSEKCSSENVDTLSDKIDNEENDPQSRHIIENNDNVTEETDRRELETWDNSSDKSEEIRTEEIAVPVADGEASNEEKDMDGRVYIGLYRITIAPGT